MLNFQFHNPTRIVGHELTAAHNIDHARIDSAIEKTQSFFEGLGMGTRLRGYGLDAGEIDGLVIRLESHGMTALGEHQDVAPAIARRVFAMSLRSRHNISSANSRQ